MSTERDELIQLLEDNGMQSPYYHEAQADAIFAAGYHRPRAITTKAELESLEVGSIVRDELDDVFEKGVWGNWIIAGELPPESGPILPVVALWEPKA